MNMNASLSQQMQLRLSMTQELSQAIALLQYNSQELSRFLEAKALENPLLEVETSGQFKTRTRKKAAKEAEFDINGIASETRTTLEDHLLAQLSPNELKNSLKIFRLLIGYIDENGYFRGDTNEIAVIAKIDTDEAEGALRKIQQLDPAGIGARDLQECLLLQLMRLGEKADLAQKIVSGYFTSFAEKKWKLLARELKISLQDIQEVHDLLQKLNPRPGAVFHQDKAAYLIPDVLAEQFNGTWHVQLYSTVPSIDFNDEMYQAITHSDDEQAIRFLREKYQDYQWLARSIKQRNETIIKVASKIVEKQPLFFAWGKGQLVPLTMKEIAESLDIHESTVSRTVRDKYIGTPFGTFELKSFFTSGVMGGDDQPTSSSYVKKIISAIIEGEDKKRPVSDQEVAGMLKEQEGISISRRTVAKYREQLGIFSSSKRRRF
ncbi:RNA polymerase sigma-54 factor [Neobacillus notoginsengisoli]|uniref:RNA polymerase sigma-54 factor n=2 Tax=Neobacillus notoginsengisoli TaxID=1578198 RepID=A0A417YT29_9BACI|nr:RNA polymerase sigma-54 factor [Neobacillus notoginsengisoli]